MNEVDLFKMAGVSTSGVAIILIIYRLLKSMKGKRLVSQCCGKKVDIGVDVEEMTPKPKDEIINVKNPMNEKATQIGLEVKE